MDEGRRFVTILPRSVDGSGYWRHVAVTSAMPASIRYYDEGLLHPHRELSRKGRDKKRISTIKALAETTD